MPFARYERQALKLHASGKMRGAYRLAVALERYAVRHGDQHLADRMREFAVAVGRVSGRPFDPQSIAALEQAAQQAAAMEQWGSAVAHMAQILVRHPKLTAVRSRARANLATGLNTLGHLPRALAAYDALMEDRAVWAAMAPNFRVGFALNREIVRWYLGESIQLTGLDEATRHFSRAPFTWMAYWWLLGHVAWQRNPDRLRAVRLGSIRTFEDFWGLGYDRALWGLDLLGAEDTSKHQAEEQVRLALGDPATLKAIGRGGWFDLYADLLLFLELEDPERAVDEARKLVAWCCQRGFDGWASYWEYRLLNGPPVGTV